MVKNQRKHLHGIGCHFILLQNKTFFIDKAYTNISKQSKGRLKIGNQSTVNIIK